MPTLTTRPTRDGIWAFRSEPWILAGLLVVLGALAFLFPSSGDDWAWGTVTGTERLDDRFDGYNGRWLGNFAVLFLTRVTFLTPIVVAVTLCLVLRLLVAVAGMRNPAGYAAGTALILTMPLGQWRQTIVWVSGFSNYALASVGLLLFILCVKQDWTHGWRASRRVAALVLPVAFASQLFIEHVSVYLVIASLANVVLLARHRRSVLVAGAWAVGALGGAALMFSNSAYRAIVDGTQGYQSVGGSGSEQGGLRSIIDQGTGGVSQYAITFNTAWNVTLLLLLVVLASIHARRGRLSPWQFGALAAAGVGVVGSEAIASSLQGSNYFSELTKFSWIPALGILVALVLAATTLVEDRLRSRVILALTASAVVLIAPMAALSPYGPRNFLPPYLVLVAIALVLLAEISAQVPSPTVSPVVVGVGLSVSLAVLAGYFAVYASISSADQERNDRLRQAVEDGRSRVQVLDLPHPGHVHNPDPKNPVDLERFLRYHELPADLKITFVPR